MFAYIYTFQTSVALSNVLVTGATGILGRIIALQLVKSGKKVRAAKRSTSNVEEVKRSFRFYTDNPELWFQKIEWIDVDLFDQDQLEVALQNIDEVYHTAAKVSFDPKDRKVLYHTNIEGTKQLLYACQDTQVKKFCFISSIAVFDGLNESGSVDETCDYNPKLNHSPYAISKHFAEMEAWRASAEGLNVVIINPGVIIGSGNWSQSSGTLFQTFKKNTYTFSGGTAYVDVRDVATISIQLMDKNAFGEAFIAVSENLSYQEVGTLIRRNFGLAPPKIISNQILYLGLWMNRLLGWLIPKLKWANSSNIAAVTTFYPISNEKVTKELSYYFIPIKESIAFHLENYNKDVKTS